MQIALKESRETRYWLCLVLEADLAPGFGVEALIDEATQLKKLNTVDHEPNSVGRSRQGAPVRSLHKAPSILSRKFRIRFTPSSTKSGSSRFQR